MLVWLKELMLSFYFATGPFTGAAPFTGCFTNNAGTPITKDKPEFWSDYGRFGKMGFISTYSRPAFGTAIPASTPDLAKFRYEPRSGLDAFLHWREAPRHKQFSFRRFLSRSVP
ncbi:MAG: hypothetical protein ABI036_10520 [Fibrobacteria bacterium]